VTDVAPRAAAFFDLDRTLIAGSSAYAFARAAGGAGLISHRQLARGAWANVRFASAAPPTPTPMRCVSGSCARSPACA